MDTDPPQTNLPPAPSRPPLDFRKGLTVQHVRTGKFYVLMRRVSLQVFRGRPCAGEGGPVNLPRVELQLPPRPGMPVLSAGPEPAPAGPVGAAGGPDLAEVKEEDFKDAERKFQVIKPLLGLPRGEITRAVKARAEETGVHETTVFRWITAWRNGGERVSALLRLPPAVPRGTSRLSEEAEALIRKTIKEVYATPECPSVEAVALEVQSRCRLAKLPEPSNRTVRRRIENDPLYEHELARKGRNLANRHLLHRGRLEAAFPLHYVQIDHCLLDVILVDETTAFPVGRPFLTVALDVWSRMVLGYYLSPNPPGAMSAGMAAATATLPKDEALRHYTMADERGVPARWPCFGLPHTLHLDNAKEFHGTMLERACREYGMNTQFRLVRTPRYGGHIESYLGKLAQKVHLLPGTTFSNAAKRAEYDSEAKAVMSFNDFDHWLANEIIAKYHYTSHSALGMTPLKRWEQGIRQFGVGKEFSGEEAVRLRLDFMPCELRTVQGRGVQIGNIHYYGEALDSWSDAPDPDRPRGGRRKFTFRFDPGNISRIFFWNPELREYFPVGYADTTRPAMSVWQREAAIRLAREEAGADQELNESMVFAAHERQQEGIRVAVARARKIRRRGGVTVDIQTETVFQNQPSDLIRALPPLPGATQAALPAPVPSPTPAPSAGGEADGASPAPKPARKFRPRGDVELSV